MLGTVGASGGREDPGQETGLVLQEGLQIQILQELNGGLASVSPRCFSRVLSRGLLWILTSLR